MEKNNFQKFRLNISQEHYIEDIVEICRVLRFQPKRIMEIGVGDARGVSTLELIKNGASAIVFEPNRGFYDNIVADLGETQGLTIVNVGIYHTPGIQKFYDKWACTFIGDLYDYSGAKIQDKYEKDEKDSFLCSVDTIDHYDFGDVDLLCMDCESCEWFVLEKLRSRPTIIQIETHSFYSAYEPFNIEKIREWFNDNDYSLFAINEGDSIFVKTEYLENVNLDL